MKPTAKLISARDVFDNPSTPRAIVILLFAFGAAQFFVQSEPGIPELLFPLLLLFITQRAILHPAQLLLLASGFVALTLEFLTFRTTTWSIISIYLALAGITFHSIALRYNAIECVRAFVLGGAAGAGASLAALLTPVGPTLYRYGIRFEGFFMDPNVTAPTGAFFAVLALLLPGRWKWAGVFPLLVFVLAISRATFLAAGIALLYLLIARYRYLIPFAIVAAPVAALSIDGILALINEGFSAAGRGSIINYYDEDRTSNWEFLLRQTWDRGAPLGPTYSDRLYGTGEGISAHSTYLRLLVEQGPLALVLFVGALLIAWRSTRHPVIRATLLLLAVNGAVIDATHWRVLFLAVAIALVYPDIASHMKPGTRRLARATRGTGRRPSR
ncbi:O-antigen ligase family protein [Microbacterium aerolatum]|uniref:O-antigen ligase family protein n=1 Tax=Microbacterium aerolatum TaxID=153731 RepID=UPI002001B1A1|nr:O-antigen ligase family protein [Microbacterium aerolatum]MCK3771286.1 O-antigen ligase family protein [Microbacterium aerolatum]